MSLPTFHVRTGDCLEQLRLLPAGSVQCVVTSPPYWSLRDYRMKGQIGLEVSPAVYVAKLVEVFAEVRRVLRDDGTLWMNLGDAYAQGGRGKVGAKSTLNGARYCVNEATQAMKARGETYRRPPPGLKPKDLIGLPWKVAFALQEDGWYLRSDIIWAKPNAMPEPVLDRPTKAHEYLFLLSKSERYFYDAEAIKEAVTGGSHTRGSGVNPKSLAGKNEETGDRTRAGFNARWRGKQNESWSAAVRGLVESRNKRSVWSIPSAPTDEAHFATFPEDLVRPCILAGTSERGCCSSCGASVVRQVKRTRTVDGEPADLPAWRNTDKAAPAGATGVGHGRIATETQTVGWKPGCRCVQVPAPSVVLDPFSGSGTTGIVALKQGRSYIGLELNPEYVEMSERRLRAASPLLAREVAS